MLLNLSNHPFLKWDAAQRAAAEREFGAVEDLPFPAIDPGASLGDVVSLAEEYAKRCRDLFAAKRSDRSNAVHLMGEFTFTYQFLKAMEAWGIPCVASTTERAVTINSDGSKTTVFRFVQFRKYF